MTGPGFTLTINGEAAAGDTIHLSTLSGAASGMRFLLEKPQQLAAASGLLIAAMLTICQTPILSLILLHRLKNCCHALIKF